MFFSFKRLVIVAFAVLALLFPVVAVWDSAGRPDFYEIERRWKASRNTDSIFERPKSPFPPFRNGTDSRAWLRSARKQLIYHYGRNETSPATPSMVECLLRTDTSATHARAAIEEIAVNFEVGRVDFAVGGRAPRHHEQALMDVAVASPNLKTVKWPNLMWSRPPPLVSEGIAAAKNVTWVDYSPPATSD